MRKSLPLDRLTREEISARLARHSERAPSGCLLWTGSTRGGYGLITLARVVFSAHRVSYELHVGEIPEGKELDHLCRVRNCIEPSHLEAVSHKVNGLRGISFAAVNAKATHCKYGHPFTPENLSTYYRRNGERICLTCHRKRSKETRARARMGAKAC